MNKKIIPLRVTYREQISEPEKSEFWHLSVWRLAQHLLPFLFIFLSCAQSSAQIHQFEDKAAKTAFLPLSP